LVVTQRKALLLRNYCADLELHPQCSQVREKTHGDMGEGGSRGGKQKGRLMLRAKRTEEKKRQGEKKKVIEQI